MAAEQGTSSNRSVKVLAGLLALVVGIGGGYFLATSGDDEDAGSGEIFLTPAADVGADPFDPDPSAAAPDPSLAQPAEVLATPITVDQTPAVASNAGGTPGLYGGTRDSAACDPQKMVDFLAANPDKAAAWVAALDADPDVRLPDGSRLTVATIPDYVATLTPLVLMQDTRVTNHGFTAGSSTAFQAVLQRGTAVLVDDRGVPRVRCYCGNPLLPPVPSSSSPTYTGSKWPDFDPVKVTVVQTNPTAITTFTVTDLTTGRPITITAGSTITPPGSGPAPTTTTPASTASTASTTTTAPPSTTTTAPASTTTTAPPTTAAGSGIDGNYAVTQSTTTCDANGGSCDGTASYTMSVSCSGSTCDVDFGSGPSTYTRSGDTLTLSGPNASVPFTCDGVSLPTAFETRITFGSGGSVSYETTRRADPVPPSCPQPFLVVTQGTGSRT